MKRVWTMLVCGIVFGVSEAFAQGAGPGAAFDARSPHVCATRNDPGRGAISADQAKRYFTCEAESIVQAGSPSNNQLFLVTGVSVQVGAGRRFNAATDSNCTPCTEIDTAQLVYPIRGSYTQWLCGSTHPGGGVGVVAGKNCWKTEQPQANGMCFKTTFKDWHCVMGGSNTRADMGQPPPKGD